MAYSFYQAASVLEQIVNPTIDERVELNEMFRKAFDLVTSLRSTPLNSFGRKVDMSIDPVFALTCLPAYWGVNMHKRLNDDKKTMSWVVTISMTSTPTTLASVRNSVSGRAPTVNAALFAAIMRAGHHIEVEQMTAPFPDAPGPMVA